MLEEQEKQEKQEKNQITGVFVFSLIIFASSFAWMVYNIFHVDVSVLSAIFTFLEDSSGFLTFLCIVMIAVSLRHSDKQYQTAILNIVNIVLLNRLYLNSQWVALYKVVRTYLSEMNWTNVLFFCAIFVAVGYCIFAGWKSRHKKSIEKNDETSTSSPQPSAHEDENIASQETLEGTTSNKQNDDQQETRRDDGIAASQAGQSSEDINKSNEPRTTSESLVIFSVCVSIVVIYIIQLLVFDVWKLVVSPKSLSGILSALPILVFLCMCYIIYFIIYNTSLQVLRDQKIRITALFAMFLESGIILAIVRSSGKLPPDFLSNFMDGVVNNILVALPLILIAMFIFLDIFISIIMKIMFGADSHDWIKETEKRIALIERGITIFVCNLMIGCINLLLFIPDFFNLIGQLLLDEDSFFPQEKLDVEKLMLNEKNAPEKEHSTDSKEPD